MFSVLFMMKIVASDMTSDLLQFHGLAAVVFSNLIFEKKKFATCRGAVDAAQCQPFFLGRKHIHYEEKTKRKTAQALHLKDIQVQSPQNATMPT